MKAVIPAAGKGMRLKPLTDIAPKPLLPVYNKPMIFYPLLTLREAEVNDIIFVVDADNQDEFKSFFKDGKDFGLKVDYALQKEQLGIAHAILQAEELALGEDIVVIHGDNIIEDPIKPIIESFLNQSFELKNKKVRGAKLTIKPADDPERFGVVEFRKDKIINIEEKPSQPKSNWITTGLYMFDERAFDVIKTLRPSARGELEITDLANFYVKEGSMTYEKLQGAWFDVGTIPALQEASAFIANNKRLREWNL